MNQRKFPWENKRVIPHGLVPMLAIFAVVATLLIFSTQTKAADDLNRAVTLMARVGSASSPSFSPDGKRVAFVSNLNGIPQIWAMPASGGFPTLVTAFDDPVGFVSMVSGWRVARAQRGPGRRFQ